MQLTDEQKFAIASFRQIVMSPMSLETRSQLVDMFIDQVRQNTEYQIAINQLTAITAIQQLPFIDGEGGYPDW